MTWSAASSHRPVAPGVPRARPLRRALDADIAAVGAEARRAIERLAVLDRASCSPGEHEAARLIAAALRDREATAYVQHSRVHGTYWWPLGLTSLAGLLRQRRRQRCGHDGAPPAASVSLSVLICRTL